MNIKTAIVVTSTLLIGFALGFLVNGRIVKERIGNFVQMRTEDGFRRQLERQLQLGEDQEEAREILEKYAGQHKKMMESLQSEMSDLHQTLEDELSATLSEEQMERLEQFKRLPRHHHKGHRPPPLMVDNPEATAQELADKMAERLGLDDAVKNKLYQIHLTHFKTNKEAMKEHRPGKMHESRRAHREAMKNVLNADQLETALTIMREVIHPGRKRKKEEIL